MQRHIRDDIARQYAEQRHVLGTAGVLMLLPSGESGIIGIDGRHYPFPTLDTVTARIAASSQLFQEKQQQGFTRLLIVPFGMRLSGLLETYGICLRKSGASAPATHCMDAESDYYELVGFLNEFRDADIDGSLIYDPLRFDVANHGGKTKQEILAMESHLVPSSAGFRILLVEDLPPVSASDHPAVIRSRADLTANRSADDCLALLKKNDAYRDEHGFSPEDRLTFGISELLLHGRDRAGPEDSGQVSFLLGTWLPASSCIPVLFSTPERGLKCGRRRPSRRDGSTGAATAVRF